VFLALADIFEKVSDKFGDHHYLGPFIFLLLCGLGFPSPEEVALLYSGVQYYLGNVDFLKITLVCSAAILIGDSIPFWLGRHYGLSALKLRWVARILHPERFAALERRFASHGNWAIFTCRFLPGLRIPGYFVAGTMRMSYLRFMALDSLGVVLSVPASIYLGKIFGSKIDELRDKVHGLHIWLGFGVVALVLIVLGRAWLKRRERAALDGSPPPQG
jgi:membrane protein DedA with SNARE-associated domain